MRRSRAVPALGAWRGDVLRRTPALEATFAVEMAVAAGPCVAAEPFAVGRAVAEALAAAVDLGRHARARRPAEVGVAALEGLAGRCGGRYRRGLRDPGRVRLGRPALMDRRLSVPAAVVMLAVLPQGGGARAGEQHERQGAGDGGLHVVQSCGARPLR